MNTRPFKDRPGVMRWSCAYVSGFLLTSKHSALRSAAAAGAIVTTNRVLSRQQAAEDGRRRYCRQSSEVGQKHKATKEIG
ncbi:hypothetical protein E4U19_005727 [Claviceps sp. Clav32 group G5]|nr:hypothetical protein E4U19_005727 [Claviceps sp. Clav32 group G5]